MSRDGSSGGVIRIGCIDKTGIDRTVVLGEQIPRFYEG
jgi:20S proteasome subunit beta 1